MNNKANASKERWNARHKQLKVWVLPEIAKAFKAKCKSENVSMADELTRFICGRCNESAPQKRGKEAFRTGTRPQRKKSLESLTHKIEELLAAEDQYKEAIPENLRNSCRYEAAERTVSALEESLEMLGEAYS